MRLLDWEDGNLEDLLCEKAGGVVAQSERLELEG